MADPNEIASHTIEFAIITRRQVLQAHAQGRKIWSRAARRCISNLLAEQSCSRLHLDPVARHGKLTYESPRPMDSFPWAEEGWFV